MIIVPRVFLLFLLPPFVWAWSKHYLDDANTTAWTFDNNYHSLTDGRAWGGSYRDASQGTTSTGTLDFQGSYVEIYGVTQAVEGAGCHIDFSWPGGSTSYRYTGVDKAFNTFLARASGFDPKKVYRVSFVEQSDGCYGGPDYAIVYVDDVAAAASPAITSLVVGSSEVKRLTGTIVGGVIGGIIGILILLGVGFWLLVRSRKVRRAQEAPTAFPAEPQTGFDNRISLRPNTLVIPEQEKPANNNTTNVSNSPPWPQLYQQ
ncbi:hypothetical protein DL96DRAFT_1610327 [Flagelloscypha sp. PMI_526]|nr:hypothetical protein DL96DRAFT_1610327 [Flagelloscypha sp. PMI_526]